MTVKNHKSFHQHVRKAEEQHHTEINCLLQSLPLMVAKGQPEAALKNIGVHALNAIGALQGYVVTLDGSGQVDEIIPLHAADSGRSAVIEIPLPIKTLKEEAYRTCRAVYHNAFQSLDEQGLATECFKHMDNLLFAPAALDGTMLGLMCMANKPGGFSPNDAELAEAFSTMVAITLHIQQLRHNLITNELHHDMHKPLLHSGQYGILTEIAFGIIHELRNPMTAVACCTDRLINRVNAGILDLELFREYLTIIDEAVHHCDQIVTTMHNAMRASASISRHINLSSILESALELITYQGRLKHVEQIKQFDAVPPIRGNEGHLRQAFLALLTTVLDIIDDRGDLTISLSQQDAEVITTISGKSSDLPQELQETIFHHFTVACETPVIKGKGLSFAKSIISSYGGRVEVASPTKSCPSFTVFLPIPEEEEG